MSLKEIAMPPGRRPILRAKGAGQKAQPLTDALDRPSYNLSAVIQRTGLKPDTLRAWERRYGLPKPERSAGGHRVYSESDIQCLLWLTARQEEGMSISQAVKLWRTLEEDGTLPLTNELFSYQQEKDLRIDSNITSGGIIESLREQWIQACRSFNEREAEHILAQAFALYPPETVCVELLQKGLGQIGVEWFEGTITAQQEHFASALAMRRLDTLLAAAPEPTHTGRIVIACPPHENHTFSPLLLTLLLRRRGWEVLYLGANLPQEELAETVRSTRPNLVILVAHQLFTAATLMQMAALLAQEKVQVAYGGHIFNLMPDLCKHIAGHYLGGELASAPIHAERLVVRPAVLSVAQPVTEEYQHALADFLDKQAQIDAYVWQKMSKLGMPQRYLSTANYNFGRDITAALMLGNLDYLGTDMNWIAGLLAYRQIPTESLIHYLKVYHDAAQHFLGDSGKPLVEWLAYLLQQGSSNINDADQESIVSQRDQGE
jgi:MerR family transcriptional regulator, light-induced transcriptional regulator